MLLPHLQPTRTAPRLGALLLERGLVNQRQLSTAMAIQRYTDEQHGRHQNLGEILIAQHLISARQLKRCLRWQKLLGKASVWLTLSVAPLQLTHAGTSPYSETIANPVFQVQQTGTDTANDSTSNNINLAKLPQAGRLLWKLQPTKALQHLQQESRVTPKGFEYRAQLSLEGSSLNVRYNF